MGKPYGYELILDLKKCDVLMFNKDSLEEYIESICSAIDMVRREMFWWEEYDSTEPHIRGISAVQFISTSTIVIHTLEILGSAYINIFACKPFDTEIAEKLTVSWFGAEEYHVNFIERK
jgi:S-adenosylmethionine decarboxylase